MAAPTPISALVHSSTLVTAGIYLIIRFNKLLIIRGLNYQLLILSVITILISRFIAVFENDFKKIIALSTLRQLGLIIIILRLGQSLISFYHLLTHAIFKSLLFISSGVIIHLVGNNQDIRLLGRLGSILPFLTISIYISILALIGIVFISGFYSKDLIIEIVIILKINPLIFFIIIITLIFTVIYSIRLFYYIFLGEVKFYSYKIIKEIKIINLSIIILIFIRVIIGSLLN
ncbi:hypothetical protein EUZ93_01040 [Wolbachia pipientis]|nr:hypothetical protein [Wolbachia pipientis]NEV49098.1 hypothetical protein [Wolbachia pipientis]